MTLKQLWLILEADTVAKYSIAHLSIQTFQEKLSLTVYLAGAKLAVWVSEKDKIKSLLVQITDQQSFFRL